MVLCSANSRYGYCADESVAFGTDRCGGLHSSACLDDLGIFFPKSLSSNPISDPPLIVLGVTDSDDTLFVPSCPEIFSKKSIYKFTRQVKRPAEIQSGVACPDLYRADS